jgi:hypothetical protein
VTGDLLSDGIGIFDCDNNTYTMFGQGVPANYIEAFPTPSTDTSNSQNTAHWGDATIYLGRYIATLCTEYELLGRNGQIAARKRTLNELFLALQAYKRLDMTANRLYRRYQECTGINCPATPDLSRYSGFFIRDDVRWPLQDQFSEEWEYENEVSSDWIDNSECFNVEIKENEIAYDYPCDTTGVPCRFQRCNTLLTQDQVLGMLFGLSFVKKIYPARQICHNKWRTIPKRCVDHRSKNSPWDGKCH